MARPGLAIQAGVAESDEEKRERVMRRLAEILRGPPPSSGPSSGPVTAGSVPGARGAPEIQEAIRALGLGLSPEDTEQVAEAVREGPDPERAAELLEILLEGFQAWQRKGKKQQEEQAGEGE